MLGRLAFIAVERLRGSRTLGVLKEIANEPFHPRDVVLERQFERLSKLLAHAERTVPYYAEMFAGLGITSQDIQSFADFSCLPVLTKTIVRERGEDLVSRAFEPSALQAHHSGGSTGQPLSFYHDHRYVAASDAGTLRTMMQAGWRPGEMVAFFWGWNKKLYEMPRMEFELRQLLRRQYQFDSFRAGEEEFGRWMRTFRRLRPKVIYGYASAIAQFAAYVRATGKSLPPLRGVFSTAEQLLPEQRAQMEEAFGCPVFDCYGSSEVRNIAAQCAAGGMHIQSDFVVVETAGGDAAPGGGPQPFLLTSLRAFGMPFIRYQNDDCGTLAAGECSCGSGFPLLKLEIARTSDHFVLPDGTLVHGLFFIHRLYGSTGVANFQFHQVSTGRIVLYVVRARQSEGFDASVARAVADIRRLAPVPLDVEVREVESIALSSAGKHRYVRSDVTPPESAAASPVRDEIVS